MDPKLQQIKLELICTIWDMKDAIWMPENRDINVIAKKYEEAHVKLLDCISRLDAFGPEPFPKFFKLTETLPDYVASLIIEGEYKK